MLSMSNANVPAGLVRLAEHPQPSSPKSSTNVSVSTSLVVCVPLEWPVVVMLVAALESELLVKESSVDAPVVVVVDVLAVDAVVVSVPVSALVSVRVVVSVL